MGGQFDLEMFYMCLDKEEKELVAMQERHRNWWSLLVASAYFFCIGTIFFFFVSLSGCGLVNGDSDYIPYTQALQSHSQSEAQRIQTQSQAITDVLLTANPETKTEQALMAVFAMQSIGNLTPVPLNIIKPTTGYDVLQRHVGTGLSILTAGVTDYFAWDAVKEMTRLGGNAFYGDVMADGSFNNTENHITGSDNSSLSSSSATEKPITYGAAEEVAE